MATTLQHPALESSDDIALADRLKTGRDQVIAELRKVVWPTRNQLTTYATAVITFVVIVICILTVLDWGLSRAVEWVFG